MSTSLGEGGIKKNQTILECLTTTPNNSRLFKDVIKNRETNCSTHFYRFLDGIQDDRFKN